MPGTIRGDGSSCHPHRTRTLTRPEADGREGVPDTFVCPGPLRVLGQTGMCPFGRRRTPTVQPGGLRSPAVTQDFNCGM